MKIGGLATGMDTESIIRDMMQANRIPLDKITQKKQQLEWKLDDYRSVNRDLKKFNDNLFNNMILSTSFTQKTVAVSAPDAVSIKNVSSTNDFSGTLQIHQLAKNATMQSTHSIGGSEANPTIDLTKPLSELGLVTLPSSFKITAIQADGKFDEDKTIVTEKGTEKYFAGYVVEISATSTLESVLADINKNSDVNAFYDSFTGRIGITAKHSGDVNGPEITISGNGADALGIGGNNDINGTEGKNAIFTFNGLKTERSSNTFQINGFEATLKAVNETGITFSSAPDTDKILASVVKFVDDYNKLIEDLNAQIREPKYRDFHPLSAEQKGDMKEKEIEQWEEKAMSGTLRNDPIISSILSNMRTALMGSVEGIGSLSDIGITTSKDYLEHGKLIINEEDLRAAINEDPNKVHELFSKNGADEDNQGLARRLRTIVDINGAQKQISALAGSSANAVNGSFTLGRNLIDMDKQITRFEDRLKMTESRLWKQFTAMEMAINRLNNQSAQLASAFGG